MKIRVLIFNLLIVFSLPAYSNNSADDNKQNDTITHNIDQMMAQWDKEESPGAAIGVVKDGKLVFAKGYGSANLEYNIPITPSSIFHMASVSKQFTAFSIVLLAQQGKLSLSDDVRKYIPELPDYGKIITINHLIHHTSGLRDQWDLLIMAGWGLDDVITKEDILRLVTRQKELNFNPGDEYLYCNTGYTLLAEIVSRVSGKSFYEWTKENIFSPLDMTSTLFYEDNERIVKNRAYSYKPEENGFKKSILNYSNAGATSLFTNINDLAKWINNFYDPVVGNTETGKQMEERGILNNGDTLDYAFGQVIAKYKGLDMIAHDGADAGYRTSLIRFPSENIAVVVLSNLASFDVHNTAFRVAELFLKDKILTDTPEINKEAKESKEVSVDVTLLKEYEGIYELQPGFEITISCEDNNLMGQATGQPKFQLFATSETEFYLKAVDAQISFIRSDDNKINKMILHQNGQDNICTRMDKSKEEALNLNEYKGEFYSEELEIVIKIDVKDNSLIFKNVHIDDLTVVSIGKDKFTYAGYLTLVFGRDNKSNINSFRISTDRCRNVLFIKK